MSREFREQVQVPESEQEYQQREGVDHSQRIEGRSRRCEGCHKNFGSRCRFLSRSRSILSGREWIILKRIEGRSRRWRRGVTGISGAGAGS